MKFDRQLRPATETSWVVSYGGKTIPRWRTAAIYKIDISPYLNEKSSDFHEILYTAADFELDERHVIKNEKVALDRLRVRQKVFLVFLETLRAHALQYLRRPILTLALLGYCYWFSLTMMLHCNKFKRHICHSCLRVCFCKQLCRLCLPADENFAIIGQWTSIPATHIL